MVEVKVPDIGDFDAVPVIELFVKVGDRIEVDEAICTLESDKATMDVPSSHAGVVKEVLVQIGDKVAEGAVLIKLETAAGASAAGAGVEGEHAARAANEAIAVQNVFCISVSRRGDRAVSPYSRSTAAAPDHEVSRRNNTEGEHGRGDHSADQGRRDAAHHFLRTFDKTFAEFETNASDAELVALADTRTARAFMLFGRVAGVFD